MFIIFLVIFAISLLTIGISFSYSKSIKQAQKTIDFVEYSEYDAPDGLILSSQRKDATADISFSYDIAASDKPTATEYHAVMTYNDLFGNLHEEDLSNYSNDINASIDDAINAKNEGTIMNNAGSNYTKKIVMHLPEEARNTVENSQL